jgi:hypothetical protein
MMEARSIAPASFLKASETLPLRALAFAFAITDIILILSYKSEGI